MPNRMLSQNYMTFITMQKALVFALPPKKGKKMMVMMRKPHFAQPLLIGATNILSDIVCSRSWSKKGALLRRAKHKKNKIRFAI